MKKVAISIINYNSSEKTVRCLDSLLEMKQEGVNLIVRVVDNHSKIPFEVSTKKYEKLNLSIDHSSKNLGFSGGHNRGIVFAKEQNADYVLILNNDTTADKNLVTNLVNEIKKLEDAVAVAPKIYFTAGQEFHSDRYKKSEQGKVIWYAGGKMDWKNIVGHHRGVDEVDKGQYDKTEKTEFGTGACLLIRTDILGKSGNFDENYFLYYEDNDLCMKLKDYGNIYFVPSAILWHDNAGSTGGSGSDLQDYYISRNRMLFGMRYASVRTKVALIRESLRILRNGRKWQKLGVKDFYLRKFGRGSYPVSD